MSNRTQSPVTDITDRLDKAADHALSILDEPMRDELSIKSASTRVGACNAVTRASATNLRARLAAPKIAEIEAA